MHVLGAKTLSFSRYSSSSEQLAQAQSVADTGQCARYAPSPASLCARSCDALGGLIPVAHRLGRRIKGPLLHIYHCSERKPCPGAPHEYIAERIAAAALRAAHSHDAFSRPKSPWARRTWTAECRTDSAWQASRAPPSSDVLVASSALPRVAPAELMSIS